MKEITLSIKENDRIIAISDIHGHYDIFSKLLLDLPLLDSDYLILLGDFINKGPSNIKTIHCMMKLLERPRTYVLKGNHEYFISHYMIHDGDIDRFLEYLKGHHFHTVLHEMADSIGYDLETAQSGNAFKEAILSHFKKELTFIDSLPILLNTKDFIFVHGGYEEHFNLTEDESAFLKYDHYNDLSDVQKKTVVVGHWPTANIRHDKNTNVPYYNDHKNILFIDGGLGVKSTGELNALIITYNNGEPAITYNQANGFTKAIITKKHDFGIKEEKLFVNYPHFDIEVVEEGQEMTLCRHIKSGKTLTILNDLLEKTEQGVTLKMTYINHFLNLDIGQIVDVCMVYGELVLVKHNEEFGWIRHHQINPLYAYS